MGAVASHRGAETCQAAVQQERIQESVPYQDPVIFCWYLLLACNRGKKKGKEGQRVHSLEISPPGLRAGWGRVSRDPKGSMETFHYVSALGGRKVGTQAGGRSQVTFLNLHKSSAEFLLAHGTSKLS